MEVRTAKARHSRKMYRMVDGSCMSGADNAPGMGVLLNVRQLSKASPADARSHNRSLVLQTLYLKGPLSRAAIARATGLTKVTVSDLVSALIEEGLLEELGTDGKQKTGKPAVLVDLARTSFNLIAVDLSSHESFKGVVLDLNTDQLVGLEMELGEARGQAAVDLAVELVQALVQLAKLPVLGVGIGSPGIVDDRGMVHVAPNLGWENVHLGKIVTEATGIPTLVVNDANAAALAEYAFGEAPGDLIFISIGHGIGAGLIVSGRLVLGSQWAAGEIGQVMVGTDQGLAAPYSREHILEHWISTPSLTRRMQGATDAEREAVLTESGQRLGVALAPIIGALNLTQVVIGGPRELIGDRLAEATIETIRMRTMPDSHEELEVRSTSLGADNVLYGCAAMTLAEVLGAG